MLTVMTSNDRTMVQAGSKRFPAGMPGVYSWFNCEACDNMIGVGYADGSDVEDFELEDAAEKAGWFLVRDVHPEFGFNGWYETVLCPECAKEQTDDTDSDRAK